MEHYWEASWKAERKLQEDRRGSCWKTAGEVVEKLKGKLLEDYRGSRWKTAGKAAGRPQRR